MLLFYIRHGDPVYDPDSLTPLGLRQAEAVGRRLATFGMDEIYASTSVRARLTAKPLCEMLHKEPVLMDWCNERYAWEQLAGDDGKGVRRWYFQQDAMKAKMVSPEVRRMDKEWYEHPYFAGTTIKEGILRVQTEADAFLSRLGYRHDSGRNMYLCEDARPKRVALFAHQGFGLAFLSSVLDIPYAQFATRFDMGLTGMTVIHFDEREGEYVVPCVLELAADGHLYKDSLPLTYHNRIPI